MKKFWTLCAALLSVVSVASAQTLSCCAKAPAGAATEVFAMLATNEEFSGGHDAPLPFTY